MNIDEKKLDEAALEKIFAIAAPIEYEYVREVDVRQKAIDACVKIAGIAYGALVALANAPKPEVGEDEAKLRDAYARENWNFFNGKLTPQALGWIEIELIKMGWNARARYVSPEVRELIAAAKNLEKIFRLDDSSDDPSLPLASAHGRLSKALRAAEGK